MSVLEAFATKYNAVIVLYPVFAPHYFDHNHVL
jgi:hypothetical protein